jgi:hypothetical protein
LKPRFWLFLRRRRFRERDSLSAFGAIDGDVPFIRLNLICHDESPYAAGVFVSLSRDVGRQRSWLAAMARDQVNHGLGEVDIEIVAYDIPPRVGAGTVQQGFEEAREVLLAAGI